MKTKLNYTVRTTRAPGETRDAIIPVIVERLSPVDVRQGPTSCRPLPITPPTLADGLMHN